MSVHRSTTTMFNGESVNSPEIDVEITLFKASHRDSQSLSFSVDANISLPATIYNVTVSVYNSSFYGMCESDGEEEPMTVRIGNTSVEL